MKIQGTRPKGRATKPAIRYHPDDWVVFVYWSGSERAEFIGRVVEASALTCGVCIFEQGKERLVKILVTNIIDVIPKEAALAMLEVQGRLF